MLAGCAGGNGFSVWSLDPTDGGSLQDPAILYSRAVPGVSIGHSASFSWDGEVLVFGHEPGGGGQAQCQATTPEVNRTMFFFEPRTGVELGRHVLPRPQTNTENCTIHNYNVVPTDKGHVLVHGSYQSGIGVVDFTDPANATEIASADPAPRWPDDRKACPLRHVVDCPSSPPLGRPERVASLIGCRLDFLRHMVGDAAPDLPRIDTADTADPDRPTAGHRPA